MVMVSALRYGIRNLRRQPVFSAVALLSIALGIGANTAIFTLLDQFLLRSLPVAEPEQLVQLDLPGPRRGMITANRPFSNPMYTTLREKVHSFTGLWAQFGAPVSFSAKSGAQRAAALLVSGNYFATLGLVPARGRLLHQSDDVSRGGHPVVVLSYGFWREKLGGAENVVGSEVLINGQKYLVVGIAPELWRGTDALEPPQLYIPLAMKAQITPTWDGMDSSQHFFLHVFGRLRPGITPAQAKAELDAVLGPVLQQEVTHLGDVSEKRRQAFLAKRIVFHPAVRGNLSDRDSVASVTWTLMAMVAVVLLIACANVANLLLARGSSRKKEIAVRLAMGASRRQLVSQLLTESMVLAGLGGLLGLLLSDWILSGILSLQATGATNFAGQMDMRTLLFTLVLTVLTGLLFGLLPALQATKAELAPTLKDQAASVVGGGVWVRKMLVVGQVCLSVILLAAAGFFTKTLFALRQADPGFQTERLLTFTLDPSLNGYRREAAEQLHRRVAAELAAMPTVRSVTMAENPVLDNSINQRTVRVEGYAAQEGEDLNPRINVVGAGYFQTLGVPVLRGREFHDGDTMAAPKVAVVNEKFARYFFKDADPIGRRVLFRDQAMTIVGVVANLKHGNPREDANAFRFVYTPVAQAEVVSEMSFYIRTVDDSTAMARDVRAVVRRLDPNLPVVALRTVRDQIDVALTLERLISALCSGFGLVATVLASIGLYGVMAFHVARRTREIGIRMALGASQQKVLWMVLREVSWMVACGVGLGVPMALGLGQLVKSQISPTQPTDPLVLMGASLLLCAVALGAGWIPARRAASVDPMQALRYE
jgi:predicted permease